MGELSERADKRASRRKPIVFDDIEFATSPTECIRAHAYHRQELCAKLEGTSPGIHRYRTYVNGQKVCDAVVCDGCRVSVARVARRKLGKLDTNVAEIFFGPHTKNTRTDYYIPVPIL